MLDAVFIINISPNFKNPYYELLQYRRLITLFFLSSERCHDNILLQLSWVLETPS